MPFRFKKLQANKEEKVDFRANLKQVNKDKFGLDDLKAGVKDRPEKEAAEGDAAEAEAPPAEEAAPAAPAAKGKAK